MPATATITTRSIQGESLSAAADRLVNTILVRAGVVDVAGGSFAVAQNLGADMNVKVGSGTAYDRAVVEGASAGQGTFVVEHQNASQVLPIAASDPTNDRIDIVVLRVYDDTFDSSGNEYADLEVIQGTPAASPSPPAVPSSAVKLAEVLVGNGVTQIVNGDITDTRYEAPARGQHVDTVYYTANGSFVKADYPWLGSVVVKVQAGGGGGGGRDSAPNDGGGGGGGGGGYAESRLFVSDLSSSETVTVGSGGVGVSAANGAAGGASSFGAHVTTTGGGGGQLAQGADNKANGGTLGDGTLGDLTVEGQRGGDGRYDSNISASSADAFAGGGGSAHLGHGGQAPTPGQSGVANLGRGYGGGGSGIAGSGAGAGGNGADGIVIVELYA